MTYSIDHLKANNARHLWHPMAHPKAMQDAPPDIIARGEGVWIWDIDGHRMLDGVGGLWSANLGHSNRQVRDAIIAQLDELPFFNTFRGTTHPRAIELSTELVRVMAPENIGAVMFGSGGSDAVEAALKIARQYWKVRGQADRTKFISLRQGYHGVHFGGMSVNGNTNFRRAYEPLLPGCFHIPAPWLYRNPYTDDPAELGRICAELLEREIVFQGPDTVAAFIGEPTSMQVIVAHKGKHNYRVVVTGKPVHSSLAPAGVNAIDYAAELILKIRDINRRFAEGPRDEAFDIPVSTAHTGVISGGTVLNIVPESCEFAFEFRMLPGISHQTFEDEVRSFARDVLEPRMKAIDPATGIVIELVNGTPGFDTDLGSAVIPMAKALAGRNDHAKVAYGTEAGLFVHMAGVPSIVVGPGSIEQAHRPDEFIEMAELGRCERFIDRLIERCC